jgi:hypothetical protein
MISRYFWKAVLFIFVIMIAVIVGAQLGIKQAREDIAREIESTIMCKDYSAMKEGIQQWIQECK